jgi:PKD repeat protein
LSVGRGSNVNEIVKEQYITVNYPSQITANFSADKTTATNEDIISFKDLSKGYPNEWLWSFTPKEGGEIITSTEQNPQMMFSPGIYTVKLVAKNPKASSDKVMVDYITVIDKNAIAADFGAQCRNTYAGGYIHFLDKTLGMVEDWKWTFEGGNPSVSTDQNPVVQYVNPGKYKVTLTAKNSVNSSVKEKEGYVYVISAEKLVLYLPFDGDKI